MNINDWLNNCFIVNKTCNVPFSRESAQNGKVSLHYINTLCLNIKKEHLFSGAEISDAFVNADSLEYKIKYHMFDQSKCQELFDFIVNNLIVQNAPSINGAPALHGINGRKCPIGYLIDDLVYSPWMERKSTLQLFMDSRFPDFLRIRYDDICMIGKSNDGFMSQFFEICKTIADQFHLNWSFN